MVIKFSCSQSRFLKMGASLLTKLISEAKAAKDVITLEATVITGFELQAVEECKEKCKPVSVVRGKGRIFFNIKKDGYPSVFKLRAVDNVYIVNESFDTFEFTLDKEKDSEIIKNLVTKVDWKNAVQQWAELTGFKGVQFPKCAEKDPNEPLADNEPACQRCLGLLKPPEMLASKNSLPENIEREANPTISLDSRNSPPLLADCDKKDFFTVPEIDSAKLTVKNDNSDDDNSFHSAEEDCVEIIGGPVKTIEASKCIPDSSSGGEMSEDIKVLAVQSEEISGSSEKSIPQEDLQNSSTGKDQKSELLSVSNDVAKNTEVLEQTEKDGEAKDNKREETKRGKKMGFWKKRREEGKGKGKKKVPKPPPKPFIDDGIIKFRVTCHRSGKKHSFDSNDAAMHFGGMINDEFHWTVDLTRWDINVVLVIEDQSGYVTFGLTKESFHRRNISHFGPTTLRSTLCYSLIRYAEPRIGDIVIDPMCGGGSISIEGSKGFPKTFHICGDNNEKCVARTKENLLFNTRTEPLNMDAFRWNAKSLPLRDQSVDVLVTDLPFGLRMGKWKDNNALYDAVLQELARVVRSGSGRAAVLTYDKAAMIKTLRKHANLWREIRSVMVNHGGIKCVVFLLLRKSLLVDEAHDVKDAALGLLEEDQTVSSNLPESSKTEGSSSSSLDPLLNDPQNSALLAPEEADKAKSKPLNKSNRNKSIDENSLSEEKADKIPQQDVGQIHVSTTGPTNGEDSKQT